MVKQFLIMLLCATSAMAFAVELSWDANSPEENVIGYKAYVRNRTTQKPFVAWSTVHTQTSVVLQNLSSNHKYEFRVTAFNTSAESGYSNPVYIGAPVSKIKIKRLRGSIR
jgi:hypothetical protein